MLLWFITIHITLSRLLDGAANHSYALPRATQTEYEPKTTDHLRYDKVNFLEIYTIETLQLHCNFQNMIYVLPVLLPYETWGLWYCKVSVPTYTKLIWHQSSFFYNSHISCRIVPDFCMEHDIVIIVLWSKYWNDWTTEKYVIGKRVSWERSEFMLHFGWMFYNATAPGPCYETQMWYSW